MVFENYAFAGNLVGTLLFSASGGLSEVLLTPTVAAIPAEDPDSELSKLHSIYAWGVVAIVVLATLFLPVFGVERWQYPALLLALILPRAIEAEGGNAVGRAVPLVRDRGIYQDASQ